MILVIAEHGSDASLRASREAIALAQTLQAPVSVLVPGQHLEDIAAGFSDAAVEAVVRLEHEALTRYTNSGYVQAIGTYIQAVAPSLVLLPHTYRSRDFAPRLAARLRQCLVPDCIAVSRVDTHFVFTRPIFHGKLLADLTVAPPVLPVATLQVGAVSADTLRRGESRAPVRVEPAALSTTDIRQQPGTPFRQTREAIDLSKAGRIVAIGRGFKDEAQVTVARDLAAALGAELAASRPICDAGWLPLDRQIGSSGQTVAPRLYVALGISGAIQHVVGMKGARTIVAVNKDADAPIFEVAHYGIIGDVFEVVPAMLKALANRSAGPV